MLRGSKSNRGSVRRFNLQATKAQVLKELSNSLPAACKRFVQSPDYDAMLATLILYFVARFQHQFLTKALEKAEKQHLEDYSPIAVELKIQDLAQEAATLRARLSPMYAMMIMRHSSYKHQNRDRLFFEGVYITLINSCDLAFASLCKRNQIEVEIGDIFRGRHFNLYRRTNGAQRSVDTLSVKELYAIKHETSNRTLNSKLISSLHEKPVPLSVQAASVNNSPLVSSFITSPITTRAIMKDPQLRKEMMDSVAEQGKRSHSIKGSRAPSEVGSPKRGTAAAALSIAVPRPAPLMLVTLQDDGGATPGPAGDAPLSGARLSSLSASSARPIWAPTPTEHGPRGGVLGFQERAERRDMSMHATERSDDGDRYVGPGFEHAGSLYDDNLSSLDELKAYISMGRRPGEEGNFKATGRVPLAPALAHSSRG